MLAISLKRAGFALKAGMATSLPKSTFSEPRYDTIPSEPGSLESAPGELQYALVRIPCPTTDALTTSTVLVCHVKTR